MPWPKSTDYIEAVQNLHQSMADEELRAGQLIVTPLGLPMVWSGGFADVYKIHNASTGNSWALKCFTKKVDGQAERYQHISNHLKLAGLPFMVDFTYLSQGIRVQGEWYPALKMRWVEGGIRLNEFVEQYLNRPRTLKGLLKLWTKMSGRLRQAAVGHCDLQHGNVLMVPRDGGSVALRLIDYDGIHVPALAGRRSPELGHPAFQHPERSREGIYSAEVDRFSHLAIYTSIHCLTVGREELWKRFNNGDNLLFREADFRNPSDSAIFRTLWHLPDADARALVGRLSLACVRPLDQTALLTDVVQDRAVAPLSVREENEAARILGVTHPSRIPALPPLEQPRIDDLFSDGLISELQKQSDFTTPRRASPRSPGASQTPGPQQFPVAANQLLDDELPMTETETDVESDATEVGRYQVRYRFKFSPLILLKNIAKSTRKTVWVAVPLAICALAIWSAILLFQYSRVWLEHHGAVVPINRILDSESPNPKMLGKYVQHLVWYSNNVEKFYPGLATKRNETLKGLIPQLPSDIDVEPLLEFTPDSFAYEAVLSFAARSTDFDWRIQKSCDFDPNVRVYGADLLMRTLPLVEFDNAARSQLMDRTSIEEKRRRFEPFRSECQAKAERILPGEFSITGSAEYVSTLEQSHRDYLKPVGTTYSFATKNPVLQVSCHGQMWTIAFFQVRWTGRIEQMAYVDLECAAKDVWGAFSLQNLHGLPIVVQSDGGETMPGVSELLSSTLHLRYIDDHFLVDFTPLPKFQRNENDHSTSGFKRGFRSFNSVLVKCEE